MMHDQKAIATLKNMKPLYYLLATLGFLLLLISIVLLADAGKLPWFVSVLYAFPNGDKIGHFILMGLFSLLVNLSLKARVQKFTFKYACIGVIIPTILVTIEEISQSFFINRTASWQDLACSFAGILFFGLMAWNPGAFYKKGKK
jgi:hypothetical protein